MYPTQQLRRLARIKNGSDHSQVQDDLGEFPVYGSGGEFARASRPLYSGPSVLLGRKGTIDRPLLVDGAFWTVDTMFCAQPYATVNPTFLYYACTTIPFDLLSTSTALPSMTQGDLNAVRLPAPETETQRLIAEFLDRETAKIDALIEKQEQLIATLREDRAATITQAVTKGLNQSVKLQYTGIAVMDAIPSHWSLRKLKHLAGSFEQGVSPQASAELATEGWGVLKSGCVNGGVFRDIEHKKLPQDFEFDGRLAVAVGDLLVCRASGSPNLVGSAAIVQKLGYQLILSDKIFRLTPNRRSSLDYLEWALNARPYREQVLGAISGAEGLANNLPLSSLRNFWFAVPPIAEQQEIARFLGERCTKIDTLIAKSTEMIETLREYRSALITNAVTGKIDVREAV